MNMTNKQPPQHSASELCIPCGLCCDGSLFGHAHLHDGEQDKARDFGMSVDTFGDHAGFHLPCPQFKGGCCSVYDQQRPHICGVFRCKLMNRYMNGLVDLDSGLESIRTARTLLANLARLAPSKVPAPMTLKRLRQEMAQLSELENPDERLPHVEFMLTAAKYEMFILSKFRPQRKAPPKKDEVPEMSGE